MLRRGCIIILINSLFFGSVYSGGFPLSEETLKYNDNILFISDFCPNVSRNEEHVYDKEIIEKVIKILQKYNYSEIILIRKSIKKRRLELENKMLRLHGNTNIAEYNRKHIPIEIYNKGYNFLQSQYKDGSVSYDEMIALSCYPYIVKSFIGPSDHRFFTEKNDYIYFILYNSVESAISQYLTQMLSD